MKRVLGYLSAALLVLASAGCGKAGNEASFRAGVPDDGSVQIKVPQKAGALVGQTADWYKITYGVTTAVNGTVAGILGILHAVVSQPATSHPSANVYVWGPGHGSPLDPLVYRLTVTDTGNHTYTYNLDAKGKNDPDTAFVTILSGTHTPVVNNGQNDDKHGNGEFLLDWDKRATLANPPKDAHGRTMQGTWDVTYDHRTADVKVDVAFNNVLDDQGHATNSTYHFKQVAGSDGLFQFSTHADVNQDVANGNPLTLEFVTVESRWHQDGSGRADVEVSQGDVPAGQKGQASQCWDSSFISQYETVSLPNGTGGTASNTNGDATQCTFATAEYFGG